MKSSITARGALAAAMLLASVPALAIDDGSDSSRSNRPQFTFSGLTFSRVSTDFENLEEAINLGFGLGVRIPSIEWVGLELDTSISVIPGENLGTTRCRTGSGLGSLPADCPNDTRSGDELQMQVITLYGALRSPGRFFGVGKLGYRYMNTTIPELEEDGRSGTAWVLGAGYRYNERGGTVELLYTQISDKMDAIGLSISY